MNSTATGYIIGLSGLTFTFALALSGGILSTAVAVTFVVTTTAITAVVLFE